MVSDSILLLLAFGGGFLLCLYKVVHHIFKDAKGFTGLEKVRGNDALWIYDAPDNRLEIVGLIVMDELTLKEFQQLLTQRMLPRYRRMRQRLVYGDGKWFWEEVAVCIDDHVDVAPQADQYALKGEKAIQDFLASMPPLQKDRPLWHWTLLPGFEHGKVACILQVHHAVSDGISMVNWLQDFVDKVKPSDAPATGEVEVESSQNTTSNNENAKATFNTTAKVGAPKKVGTRTNVFTARFWVDLVTLPFFLLWKLILRPMDYSCLHGKDVSGRKKYVWSDDSLTVEDMKVAKDALGATFTEVLVACLGGALADYQMLKDQKTSPVTLSVPISLRKQVDTGVLNNEFCIVFLPMPVSAQSTVVQRVEEIQATMRRALAGPEPVVSYLTQAAIANFVPAAIASWWMSFISNKASGVFSSVPAPGLPLTLGGKRVHMCIPFAPSVSNIALSITLYSYNNAIRVGVKADVGVIPDPETLMRCYATNVKKLLDAIPKDKWQQAEQARRMSRANPQPIPRPIQTVTQGGEEDTAAATAPVKARTSSKKVD